MASKLHGRQGRRAARTCFRRLSEVPDGITFIDTEKIKQVKKLETNENRYSPKNKRIKASCNFKVFHETQITEYIF